MLLNDYKFFRQYLNSMELIHSQSRQRSIKKLINNLRRNLNNPIKYNENQSINHIILNKIQL
jgi:hypothetical protein